MENQILIFIGQGISWIIQLLIVVACSILVVKHKNISFKLMLVGTIISIFFGIVGTLVFFLTYFNLSLEQIVFYNGIVGVFKAIGYSIFGLGLLRFALKTKRQSA